MYRSVSSFRFVSVVNEVRTDKAEYECNEKYFHLAALHHHLDDHRPTFDAWFDVRL